MKAGSSFSNILSNVFTGIAALAALVVASAVARKEFFGKSPASVQEAIAEPVEDWESIANSPNRLGAAVAPVTIVEFADFQCPACKRFHSALAGVLLKYPGRVAVALRQLPLEDIHPVAYAASRAVLCAAKQNYFAAMHTKLFEMQDSIGKVSMTTIASRAGIPDSATFGKCARAPGRIASIDADIALARRLNLRGTPSILINGLLYANVPDSARLDRLVAYHLARGKGADGPPAN